MVGVIQERNKEKESPCLAVRENSRRAHDEGQRGAKLFTGHACLWHSRTSDQGGVATRVEIYWPLTLRQMLVV